MFTIEQIRPSRLGDHRQVQNLKITVALELDQGVSRRVQVPAPDPSCWSEEDAREFVWAVWALLEAHAAESFQVRYVRPWTKYCLEFIADCGAATSEPLALSMRALDWVRSVSFASERTTAH